MHSHLDIEINSTPMALPPDFSLSVTEENPLFHDVGMHSDPVSVPMEGNRTIFQNVDDPQSELRPIGLEHLPAKIIVGGLPMRSGTVVIQEDDELDNAFAFNIDESKQSFDDLIGDLKCQDVPLFNNELIPIGEKICDVSVYTAFEWQVQIALENAGDDNDKFIPGPRIDNWQTDRNEITFDPQALGFSCPGVASGIKTTKNYPIVGQVNVPEYSKSYINVSEPYESVGGKPAEGAWRYCNARVCYAHHGLDTSSAVDDQRDNQGNIVHKGTIGETTDEIMKVNEQYAVNEDYGPYWVLDADRQQSGICFYVLYFLDCLFNHLGVAFDNSALTAIEDLRRLCFFTTHAKYVTDATDKSTPLMSQNSINQWINRRGCGGSIEVPEIEEKTLESVVYEGKRYKEGDWMMSYIPFPHEEKIVGIKGRGRILTTSMSAYVRTMYATNENFPDETVKTVLSSLEASFGIRFHYDYQSNKVTAYLLRDVFRQTDDIVNLPVTDLTAHKLSEKITGVRMKYSSESDAYEQQQNVRKAKRDYDTEFDYIDYRQDRTQVSEGYMDIATDLKVENVTCYVDKNTANAYRFKISKDVDSADIAYHRLFEVGQFHGIEVGDCSKINGDYVKELVSDFLPMSFNDVNAYAQIKRGSTQSILAAFVDEDMEHEFVTQKINHALYSGNVDIYATEVLSLVESFDPTSNDSGTSPLQEYDWGLAIAVMRGGGAGSEIINYDRNYDFFGNSRWRTTAGSYTMSSDTMDQFGNVYDYGGERFSLKIRSWKPFLYYIDASGKTIITNDLSLIGKPVDGVSGKTWLMPCNSDDAIARRGLADVFMSEFIHFLLNRTKLRLHCLAEPAVLLDIPNHWHSRFRIGNYVGYIDKLNYDIDTEKGVGEVTIDFFAI